MKSVHLSQFYPASTVETGTELYYICNLGKYLSKKGDTLSLEGVFFAKELQSSMYWDFFRFSYEANYFEDVNIEESLVTEDIDNLELKNIYMLDLSDPDISPSFLKNSETRNWKWTLNGVNPGDSIKHNKTINNNLKTQAFVALVAYVAVERHYDPMLETFELELSEVIYSTQGAIVDLIVLKTRTDAVQWLEISMDQDVFNELTFDAWYHENHDLGRIQGYVSPKEKLDKVKNVFNFKVGDPVFLYERNTKKSSDLVKKIQSCDIAIIRGINATSVSLEVIKTKSTTLGDIKRYESYSREVKSMFSMESYKKFVRRVETIKWAEMGIDYILYDEDYFISDIDKDDNVDMWVTNGEREDLVELNSVDGVFWILKDRNIEFNEGEFISRYYKAGDRPHYYKYMMSDV